MPKRNWVVIAKLEDPYLRISVSISTDTKALEGYMRGFPHLFEEGEDEGPLRIPLSNINDAAREWAQSDCSESMKFWDYCESSRPLWDLPGKTQLESPVSVEWIGDDVNKIPKNVLKQFIEQDPDEGIIIAFGLSIYVAIHVEYEEEVKGPFTEPPKLKSLSLVDVRYIAADK